MPLGKNPPLPMTQLRRAIAAATPAPCPTRTPAPVTYHEGTLSTRLAQVAIPCAQCHRLAAPADLLYSPQRDTWRCRDWQRCQANRAEHARIAAALRAEGAAA